MAFQEEAYTEELLEVDQATVCFAAVQVGVAHQMLIAAVSVVAAAGCYCGYLGNYELDAFAFVADAAFHEVLEVFEGGCTVDMNPRIVENIEQHQRLEKDLLGRIPVVDKNTAAAGMISVLVLVLQTHIVGH